jgi:orotidine-5'-phosphate decarboxylase
MGQNKNMNRQRLISEIRTKRSYLCVGLDSDVRKIPAHLQGAADPVLEFNRAIIDATRDLCVAYKLNTAFYEAEGVKGWEVMQRTVEYIGDSHFLIADAKRGDIGNTSSLYARAFFEQMNFDAVTVAPYMGEDSIRPFLEYPGKWTIVLGLTSNKGSEDFQKLSLETGSVLFREVMSKVSHWGNPGNLMFVVGATQSSEVSAIRELLPEHFFLVPGVGAQGGSLEEISQQAMNSDIGLLVNASRSVIFASRGIDFAEKARSSAHEIRSAMEKLLP